MENLQIFSYNGNKVTFKNDGKLMVNATEMAKPFSKRPVDWIKLPATTQFIDSLTAVRKSHRSDLIVTINGVGTWLHEDVALEFARWLSPEFAIWCNDRIKELLTHGMTATQPTLEQIVSNPDLIIGLASKLKQERAEKELLLQKTESQTKLIQEIAPKADYYDKTLASKDTITTTQIAKELGMSSIALNKRLNERGIQYKVRGQWVLYAKYEDRGYTKPYTYTEIVNGESRTYISTVWTQKGRAFIHQLLEPSYIWLPAVQQVEKLSGIYQEQAKLQKEVASLKEPVDFSRLPASYELCKAHADSKPDKRVVLFVLLLIYSPKALAGKKMPAGLRAALSKATGYNCSYISHQLVGLKERYEGNEQFRGKVDAMYKFIAAKLK